MTAPDGAPSTHHGRRGVGDRDDLAALAAEPGVILADRAAGPHGLAGRDEQEVGGRRGPVAHRIVDHDAERGQLDHVGRGRVDKGQAPARVDGADPFPDIQGDRGERLPLDVDLLVELGVGERPAAHGGQGLQQAPVSVIKRLIPPPSRGHQPLRPVSDDHRGGQLPGARRVGRQHGPRAAQQPPYRPQDRLEHGLLAQPPVGLQRGLVQSLHPAPVVQGREPGADQLAFQDQRRDGQGQAPQVRLDGQGQDQAGQGTHAGQRHLDRKIAGELVPGRAHREDNAGDKEPC